LSPLRRLDHRVETPEILDQDGIDERALRHNLRDIMRVNRFFGGIAEIIRHLQPLVRELPAERPITVLDLGAGAGDIPRAISRWATAQGRSVSICASDRSPEILDLARKQTGDDPAIAFAVFDARNVPLPDSSFDVVLCSLALHHFTENDAIAVLREMDRLSTAGFIVNDLRRTRIGFVAAWLASRLTTRSALTRNDAPLSVRRAFTPEELRQLVEGTGITNVEIAARPWFRMVAVQDKRRAGA
jgi:ubiquinone/menaquinone biosynthesis C-methylase UbiE